MFQRQKNWISDVLWKPKKAHSLEQLRYLHYVLTKNSTVNETNRGLLVETLRSIAEILIWGDQNDSRVFDFFLEKSMLLYFLKMMSQKSNQICVQLLQTLSILFENIRNETSLYYLLSNNHVNSIIIHKFDFSDEEVLAYYISFLKTLSLKLNRHTVHFFFNEHKNDFPLYTEAIKFFNHSESMVRIAVRTLTLNVYRVGDKNMLSFIRDKTADPYFWNLVWFIGNHAIELDNCVLKESHHLKCDRLKDLVAEHLDHLHYLHDILSLNIEDVNHVLTGHFINRLLIPLYIYSLVRNRPNMDQDTPRLGVMVALFLLSQILLIMSHPPLVSSLVDVLVNGDEVASGFTPEDSPLPLRKACSLNNSTASVRTFQRPEETLEESLVARGVNTEGYSFLGKTSSLGTLSRGRSMHVANSKFYVKGNRDETIARKRSPLKKEAADLSPIQVPLIQTPLGQTDSESESDSSSGFSTPTATSGEITKEETTAETRPIHVQNAVIKDEEIATEDIKSVIKRPKEFQPDSMFLEAIHQSLDCSNDDEEALFAICLLYAAISNRGVDKNLLESIGISSAQTKVPYNEKLVENLVRVLELGYRNGSQVRVVTLEMIIILLKELIMYTEDNTRYSYLDDRHLALIENVREASTLQLRHYYKEDEIFLDMFEDEYRQTKVKPPNVQHLMMDATLLLPLTGTPLTGIEFYKRLPCGEVEHTRRAIRVFLLMRDLGLALLGKTEQQLPLSKVENSVHLEDVLDLNNSDLIACTVKTEEKQQRRFLVIDEAQFILVEPDTTKLGWGVVKFVARLQDVETAPDKEDSRSLFITIHQPSSARSLTKVRSRPILSAKFIFDDYIRCMSAKQRLQRRRAMLRQHKLHCIAQLLELPAMASPPSHYYSITPPAYVNLGPGQLESPTDSQTNEPVDMRDQPSEHAPTSSDTSQDSVQASLAGAMATPEQCLSPVNAPGRRTTSQAEALASVLEQSPPRNGDYKQLSRSVEEATEAIEMEVTNKTVQYVQENYRSPVEHLSRSRSHSLEDIQHSFENIQHFAVRRKPVSLSAPATPRGDRRAAPLNFEDENSGRLNSNSMSEPAIFFSGQWEPPPAQVKPLERKAGKKGKGKDNPRGLKGNTAVMDDIEKANEEDHAEQKEKRIFEGDIQLTDSSDEGVDTKSTNSAETAEVDVDSVVTKRKAISSRRHLWVTKIVPVELASSASKAWNNILKAVDEIQKKSCVRFRMRQKSDKHWIRFVKKNGCFSPVGRQYLNKGAQELSIGKGCNSKGIIMHELLHALGFWHEQSRSDRDDYLEVLWENIDPNQLHNFNRYKKKDMDFFGGAYDFSSIMHYGNFAFSRNKKPTMLSMKNPLLHFGQISKMSPTDILQLNALYDCTSKKRGWSNWGNWGPCDKNCTKERERFCSADDIKYCEGAEEDRIQLQRKKCPYEECYVPINGHWGRWGPWSKCSRTCGPGYKSQSRTCDNPTPQYGGQYCKGSLVQIEPCMVKKTCGWRRKRVAVISKKERGGLQ